MSVPSVVITVDRERTWQANLSAVIALHDVLGDKAFERIQTLCAPTNGGIKFNRETFEVFRALVWCGFASEPEPPTMDAIASHLTPARLIKLIEQVLPLFNESVSGNPTHADAPEVEEAMSAT